MYPIPANATRIRYLEANGIAYIDTGVPMSTKYTIKAKGQIVSLGNTDASFLGWWRRTGMLSDPTAIEATMRLYWRRSSSAFCAQSCATTEPRVYFSGSTNDVVEFVLSNGSATVNGVTKSTDTITYEDTLHTQHLFGVYNINPNNYEDGHAMQTASSVIRIWYAQWYDENGTIVRDFVPIRVGQTPYMFDRVTGTLFGKQGEGTFTAGPDTFQQGVVPTRMMAMGVRKREPNTWDYVQDGLVAMWDGIENAGRGKHDASAMTWPDLTGTYTMTASASGDTWGKDHLNMGSTQWVVTPKSNFVNLINSPQNVGGKYSVEMVLSHTNQRNKCIFGRSYPTLDIHANGVRESAWLKNGNDINVGPAGGGLHSISLSGARDGSTSNVNQRWHYNGSNTNSATRSYTKDNTSDTRNVGLGLGEYTNRGIATAKIYCIRLYNRILTDDEVAYNYTVDKKRFNLP